jgi:hypothetical protein
MVFLNREPMRRGEAGRTNEVNLTEAVPGLKWYLGTSLREGNVKSVKTVKNPSVVCC